MEAVLAGYVRTPFTFARKGALAGVRPDDLASVAVSELVRRANLDPMLIEDLILGCAYPEGEQGDNIARITSLLAGLPQALGAATVNRFCGSSMYAIHMAAGQIAIGGGDCFIAAGVESMSRVPQGGFSRSPNPRFPSADGTEAEFATDAYISMGETAENVATRYGITRSDQEIFAERSQAKAFGAQVQGRLKDEIIPVAVSDDEIVDRDMCLRPSTTLEGLAGLKPAFSETGTVTAGTASPLTDGAVATLVTSNEFAKTHGLPALGRIRAVAVAGVEPEYMGMGPVPATRKALQRAGISVDDLDVIEINEAFASQAVACGRELGLDPEKVNIDGGALALGHPLGATGARITAKAAQILQRTGGRFALATQCIGGGQGIATIIEAN